MAKQGHGPTSLSVRDQFGLMCHGNSTKLLSQESPTSDIAALLQKQLLTTVPAHVSIAQKCQPPFYGRAVAPEGVLPHCQHHCSAASYKSDIALE